MPKIEFTATPELPHDIAHLDYKQGDVLDLPEASARRWIRRGVAKYVKEDVDRGPIGVTGLSGPPGDYNASLVYGPPPAATDEDRALLDRIIAKAVTEGKFSTAAGETEAVEPAPAWEQPADEAPAVDAEVKPRRGRKPKVD